LRVFSGHPQQMFTRFIYREGMNMGHLVAPRWIMGSIMGMLPGYSSSSHRCYDVHVATDTAVLDVCNIISLI